MYTYLSTRVHRMIVLPIKNGRLSRINIACSARRNSAFHERRVEFSEFRCLTGVEVEVEAGAGAGVYVYRRADLASPEIDLSITDPRCT